MKQKRKKTRPGGWLFLLLVLAVYGVIGVVEPETAREALGFFARIMQDVLLFLVIVFFLLLATDLLLEPEWIKRNLGREAGLRGWLMALAGGVLAAGPIYPWYALLGELREKGMRASLAAVFLYSRAIKLPLLPLMIHYFGFAYTLLLCLYLLGFSVLSGILMVKLDDVEPG